MHDLDLKKYLKKASNPVKVYLRILEGREYRKVLKIFTTSSILTKCNFTKEKKCIFKRGYENGRKWKDIIKRLYNVNSKRKQMRC